MFEINLWDSIKYKITLRVICPKLASDLYCVKTETLFSTLIPRH